MKEIKWEEYRCESIDKELKYTLNKIYVKMMYLQSMVV